MYIIVQLRKHWITNIVRPVDYRVALSTSNIAAVSESIAEYPNVFISRRFKKLGLSYDLPCTRIYT